jgi:hypothetical protein
LSDLERRQVREVLGPLVHHLVGTIPDSLMDPGAGAAAASYLLRNVKVKAQIEKPPRKRDC